MPESRCNIGTYAYPDYIGTHEPAIVHRTGGQSAETHNTCGKCGRFIVKVDDAWVINKEREETA